MLLLGEGESESGIYNCTILGGQSSEVRAPSCELFTLAGQTKVFDEPQRECWFFSLFLLDKN